MHVTTPEKRRQRKQEWKGLRPPESADNPRSPESVHRQHSPESGEPTFATPDAKATRHPRNIVVPPNPKKDRSLGILLRLQDEKFIIFDIRHSMPHSQGCSHGAPVCGEGAARYFTILLRDCTQGVWPNSVASCASGSKSMLSMGRCVPSRHISSLLVLPVMYAYGRLASVRL